MRLARSATKHLKHCTTFLLRIGRHQSSKLLIWLTTQRSSEWRHLYVASIVVDYKSASSPSGNKISPNFLTLTNAPSCRIFSDSFKTEITQFHYFPPKNWLFCYLCKCWYDWQQRAILEIYLYLLIISINMYPLLKIMLLVQYAHKNILCTLMERLDDLGGRRGEGDRQMRLNKRVDTDTISNEKHIPLSGLMSIKASWAISFRSKVGKSGGWKFLG